MSEIKAIRRNVRFTKDDVFYIKQTVEREKRNKSHTQLTKLPDVGTVVLYYWHDGMDYRRGVVACHYKQGVIVVDCEDESPEICYLHNLYEDTIDVVEED